MSRLLMICLGARLGPRPWPGPARCALGCRRQVRGAGTLDEGESEAKLGFVLGTGVDLVDPAVDNEDGPAAFGLAVVQITHPHHVLNARHRRLSAGGWSRFR